MAYLKRSGLAIAVFVGLAALAAPVPAMQNEVIAPPSPDADALAAEMRVLAANPNDVTALISAGELALKLGDPTAAARFFARADRIDSRNGRLKAGTARTLLALERPGEALRLFADAEALGFEPRNYAADRGLAFDLVGEQERAQRDYRLALRQGRDDETLRRYALSLGIAGHKDQAFAEIDGLLRQSDRGAWRVRAFVLAMTGDVAGAERIATSMLPGGMASGLLPFFQRLPSLGPADRAFAVHFGEVAPTPTRIADARLIPHFAPLPPEPAPPVRLAANDVQQARTKQSSARGRKRERERDIAPPARTAAVAPPSPSLPPAAREIAVSASGAPTVPSPASSPPIAMPATAIAPQAPALASVQPLPKPVERSAVELARASSMPAAERTAPPSIAEASASAVTPAPATQTEARATALVASPSPPRPAAPEPSPRPAEPMAAAPVAVAPAAVAAEPPIETPPSAPPPTPTPAPASQPVASEQSILARIVASIGVPASELGVTPAASPVPAPVPAPPPEKPVPAATALEKPATPAPQPAAEKPAKPAIDAKAEARAAAEKKAAEKKAAEAKLAAKHAADKAAAEKKAAKAEPSRIWVQVAGGASAADLPREWQRLQAKAGAALRGRQAWTTPLRFTNRLLTGPFKSGDDAQDFVNQLTKSGITGFVFTSEAGQKIARLPAK